MREHGDQSLSHMAAAEEIQHSVPAHGFGVHPVLKKRGGLRTLGQRFRQFSLSIDRKVIYLLIIIN